MRDVRIRTREIVGALGDQVKTSAAAASDVALIAQEIAGLRRANIEQADQMVVLGTLLGGRNGSTLEEPLESS
jgi:hypothetical protein